MKADKTKVTRLVKTAKGQLEGILRMIEEDRYCLDISNQLMAASAILGRANKEVIAAHMRACVMEGIENNEEERIEEMIALIEKLI
ncbi:MAG: metal-sensing transcriptional repressor [Christensenellaceae bacterium]|jgi:DNA-binding FrmR family transcriptional regulator